MSDSNPAAAASRTPDVRSFSCANARSASLLAGLMLAVTVETVVVHLWLAPRYPMAAWTLSTLSVLSLLWLVGDYRALGHARAILTAHALQLRLGWRATADFPLHAVHSATRPAWNDIPEAGRDKRYINPMSPVDPNVLLTLSHRLPVRLMQTVNRPVTGVGLTLDAPDAFLAAIDEARRRISTECSRVERHSG